MMTRFRFPLILLILAALSVAVAGCGAPGANGNDDAPAFHADKPLTLWFLTEDGEWFQETRALQGASAGTTWDAVAVKELLRGSDSGYVIAPVGCSLLASQRKDGVCTLVLSGGFPFEDGADSLAAQSIAKTLFQDASIQSVCLTDEFGSYSVEIRRP